MIKYLCDVENCGKEGSLPSSDKEWVAQEMFEPKVKGASYFWARVGLANAVFCPIHRNEAMNSLVKLIQQKYPPITSEGV